jgi:hypothetical protein
MLRVMKTTKNINPRRKRATNNHDHARRTHVTAPADAEVEARLRDFVLPNVYKAMTYYRQLGLRNRILNLPTMVALVLTMIWRRVPSVNELLRLLDREIILWAAPRKVTRAALDERFLVFPAELFERVLMDVVAQLPARLAARTRPVPAVLRHVGQRFAGLYVMDGTTLEALFRKLEILRDQASAPLAGHLGVLCDLGSHLPVKVAFGEDPGANDKALVPLLLDHLPAHSLTVFDLGYFSFLLFDKLTHTSRWFVTRLREKTTYQVKQILRHTPELRDQVVHLGSYRSSPSQHPVRLVEVFVNGQWRRYVTNVLDPQQLTVLEIVELYERRWHIETTFLTVKRLLDLSFVWVGSINGVQLQVWATFLFYAILIDLTDDVAEILQLPLDQISVEMVYRGLYHYDYAVRHGYTGTAVEYFAHEGADLGIVKRKRKRPDRPTALDQIRHMLATDSTNLRADPVQ